MNKLSLIVFIIVMSITVTAVSANHTKSDVTMLKPGSSEEADPIDVEEPGCPRIAQLPKITLKAMLGEWRLPYMSDHWVRFMAKSMHGKNMKKSSLTKACQKVHVKPMPEGQSYNNATIWIHTKCPKTGAEVNLGCVLQDGLSAKLFCTDMKGRTKEFDSHVLIIETDHKNYALVVRCFPKYGMNWAIFSKQKQLDHALVKELFNKVEDMGFKLKNIIEIPMEKCN